MIEITDRIALDEAEVVVTFIRASGPGGQNVNTVSSAAQLRFDVSLPDAVRLRLERRNLQRQRRQRLVVGCECRCGSQTIAADLGHVLGKRI